MAPGDKGQGTHSLHSKHRPCPAATLQYGSSNSSSSSDELLVAIRTDTTTTTNQLNR